MGPYSVALATVELTVDQANLKLVAIFLPLPLEYWVIGMFHHAWLVMPWF